MKAIDAHGAEVLAVLRQARRFVAAGRDHLLESYCVRKTRETLAADGRPLVERCERLTARIDRALGAGR